MRLLYSVLGTRIQEKESSCVRWAPMQTRFLETMPHAGQGGNGELDLGDDALSRRLKAYCV